MSQSNHKFNVTNPANGKILDSVPEMGVAGTKAAIKLAKETFKSWSEVSLLLGTTLNLKQGVGTRLLWGVLRAKTDCHRWAR